MAKNSKVEKQLEAARKSAASARRRGAENEAEFKKKLSETKSKASAKVKQVLGGRPVIEAVTASAAGMGTGYLAAMLAHKTRVANAEETTAGREVSKFKEWLGDQGNAGLLFSLAGSGVALAVSPKNPMARKVIHGLGFGMSAGGAALKGASMYRQQDTVDGPAWRGAPSAWRGGDVDRQAQLKANAARIRALLAARSAARALPAPGAAARMAPALYNAPMGATSAY